MYGTHRPTSTPSPSGSRASSFWRYSRASARSCTSSSCRRCTGAGPQASSRASRPGSRLPSSSSSAAPPPGREVRHAVGRARSAPARRRSRLRPRPWCPARRPRPRPRRACPRRTAPSRTRPSVHSRTRFRPPGSRSRMPPPSAAPTSRPIQPSATTITVQLAPLRAGGERVGHHQVGRQQQPAVRRVGLLERAPRQFDALLLDERVAGRLPCARKNGKHIAPPISSVSAMSRKRSIRAILSVTFAPPSTTTSGRRGSSTTLREGLDLALQQRSGDRRAEELGHAGRRGVRAMGSAEGVVHVGVAELGQVARQLRVVARLARLPARVLEQQHLAGVEPCHAAAHLRPHDLGRLVHARAQQLAEPRARRAPARSSGSMPFGRPRCEHSTSGRAALAQLLDRRAGRRGCARRRPPRRPRAAR